MSVCTVEIWSRTRWERAGEIHVVNEHRGYRSSARFEYDFDYLEGVELGAIDERAVSCRYPTGYDVRDEPVWPAFLLDLIPSGAARRFWERELGVPNVSASDWSVLVHGAGHAPGNLRIADATRPAANRHPGFSKEDVISRADHFLEYAREHGAEIAGASGAGGDSPKLLLREDHDGRFHADGALVDAHTARLWLVKFPRTHRTIDRVVLEAEAAYHRVAARFGVRTSTAPTWERDCLFVPRFDCAVTDGRVTRRGLESLCSLAGVTEFGAPISKEDQVLALAKFTSAPATEVREFLMRDILDVALGNTDNHARNTSVLKYGTIELAPLYDFAPMLLDSQGIARVCRWRDESSGFPKWGAVAKAHGADTLAWLKALAPRARMLATWIDDEHVPERVRTEIAPRIERVARALEEAS